MKISVTRPDSAEIARRKIKSWPIWEKEASEFDWYYDDTEECLLLEGRVAVTSEDGSRTEFGAGDFVTFPKGLRCTWKITEPVKKHYNFIQE